MNFLKEARKDKHILSMVNGEAARELGITPPGSSGLGGPVPSVTVRTASKGSNSGTKETPSKTTPGGEEDSKNSEWDWLEKYINPDGRPGSRE